MESFPGLIGVLIGVIGGVLILKPAARKRREMQKSLVPVPIPAESYPRRTRRRE
ncbi:MAG: hypothetical protein IT326_02130 [Anaerolineae bacterium]|nr:hypothetical protein [Anaerolineae bacterium]